MISLSVIEAHGGSVEMRRLYGPIESIVLRRKGVGLSKQGKASLRFFINKIAAEKGFVHGHDPKKPGWEITEHGRTKLEQWSHSQQGRELLQELMNS